MVGITIDRGMLDLVDITGDVWVVLTIVCLVLVDPVFPTGQADGRPAYRP